MIPFEANLRWKNRNLRKEACYQFSSNVCNYKTRNALVISVRSTLYSVYPSTQGTNILCESKAFGIT